jgi:ribonuclease R
MTRKSLGGVELGAILAAAPPGGLSLDEIAERLGLGGASGERRLLREQLLELARSGEVVKLGKRYGRQPRVPEQPGTVIGLVRVTQGGRGFVDLGEAYEEVMVAPEALGAAIDGDTVEVRSWPGARRREGEVVRVVSRGRVRVTGLFQGGGGKGAPWLEPDDPRLPSPAVVLEAGPGRDGQAVLADIVTYPSRLRAPLQVRVTRVLGDPGKLRTEVARSVAGGGIEEEMPEKVLRAARGLPQQVGAADLEGRLDLRELPFVTIDPFTARDFDDAVAVEPGPHGTTRVWVAVADVSHYVPEGSPLDEEARRRGCSVYLPDRAIPMLPPELSSQICSLVPDQDRLAMVVKLDIAAGGKVVAAEHAAAVIHSHGRLDYGGVAAALAGDLRGRRAGYRQHIEMLEALEQVASALRTRRLARGALDLDLPEAQVQLDEDDPDRVRDIVEARPDEPVKRAYNLIEELMVAANEAVAESFVEARQPTLWRIHAPPEQGALLRLADLLAAYGLRVDPESLATERGMGRMLRRLREHPAARPLAFQVLRTLKQAVYSTENVGHFGLASRAYLHFTSPIRRYPDLHVHRLLKRLLRSNVEVRQRSLPELAALARESTASERRAIEVERQVASLYAARLMRDHLGEEIWGTVSGVTSFGLFVTLDEPFVDGLVRLDKLGEWMELIPEALQLHGRRSGRRILLGDRLLVKVENASIARRSVELGIVGEEPRTRTSTSTSASTRKRRRR